jgi:hypothetical protein
MNSTDIVALVLGLLDGQIMPDSVDLPALSQAERREFLELFRYEAQRRSEQRLRHGSAQRRALRLWRSLLNPAQLAAWRRSGHCLCVTGSAGGTYRLWPGTALAERVQRRGGRLYRCASYCLHDPANDLPPADTSVGHLLMLLTDEPGFLATANVRWRDPWRRGQAQRDEARRALAEREEIAS